MRTLRVWVVALVVAALGLVGATGDAQAAKAKKPSGTITVSGLTPSRSAARPTR